MFKKSFVLIFTLPLIFSMPFARAGSVAGFGGSTELTQIANNIQLVSSYVQQVQAYATQLQQYQIMVKNSLATPNQVWGNAASDLQALAKVVQQGQALAYSSANISTEFQNTFKGYQAPAGTNFKTDYQKWSRATLDSIKGAFEAAKMQSDNFATEEGVLQSLRAQSTSASGQMQAIQVGNQVAEQQVQQLQKLRQLMMTQMQSQNTYMAMQTDKSARARATMDDQLRYRNPAATPGLVFQGGSL